MQHRWYSGFDWDALLEKKLEAPLPPNLADFASNASEVSLPIVFDRTSCLLLGLYNQINFVFLLRRFLINCHP